MDERLTRLLERIENRYFGKYRGTVADRADPQQLGRLKLKVPSVLADAATGWAWPAASYAGKNIGLFAAEAARVDCQLG
jgi:type VI secretion system secreted protein VgrG